MQGEQGCKQANQFTGSLRGCKPVVTDAWARVGAGDGKQQTALRTLRADMLLKITGQIKLLQNRDRRKVGQGLEPKTHVIKGQELAGREPRKKTMKEEETWESMGSWKNVSRTEWSSVSNTEERSLHLTTWR